MFLFTWKIHLKDLPAPTLTICPLPQTEGSIEGGLDFPLLSELDAVPLRSVELQELIFLQFARNWLPLLYNMHLYVSILDINMKDETMSFENKN